MDIKLGKTFRPNSASALKAREAANKENLETVYGQHWKIFIDKNNKHFIEFDVDHFASKFVYAEITEDEYRALEKDFTLFNMITRKIDPSEYVER